MDGIRTDSKIMHATLEIIIAQGIGAVNIESVARRSGVAKTTIYRRYANTDDLIDLVEDSFSSPTFELLKRDDEGAVVLNAHKNPKFVEDVVRGVLKRVTARYPSIPDDVEIVARSESQESIHKHNAFAERTATFGELREELLQ